MPNPTPSTSFSISPSWRTAISEWSSSDQLHELCFVLEASGQPAVALPLLRCLRQLAQTDPIRSTLAEIQLGSCATTLSLHREAEATLAAVWVREGSDSSLAAEILITRAELHLAQARFNEAARDADQVVKHLKTREPDEWSARLAVIQATLARLLGDLSAARDHLDRARQAIASPTARLEGQLGLAEVQILWAGGDLLGAATVLEVLIARLEARDAPHPLGEALLLAGRFAGERLKNSPDVALWHGPLAEPAALYLARAIDLFTRAGSVQDLERVRQHFLLYGRREGDRVFEARLTQRADEAYRALFGLAALGDSLFDKLGQGATDPAAVRPLLEVQAQLQQGLLGLWRVEDKLVGTAHTVAAEREHLREVLAGVERLGTVEDGDQLAREVVSLAARVVDADCVVLALVSRTGELQLRESQGFTGGDAIGWRFLAEQARRSEQPQLEAPPEALDPLSGRPAGTPELGTAMAVPVARGGRVHGVLYADRKQRGGYFTREQLRLQCAVAGQAGTLLENQRMTWALRVAARTRETTMEAISDGVLAVSTEGQIRSANTAAARMLGRPKAEVERLGLRDLPGLGDAEALVRPEVLDGRVVRLPEGEAVVGARVVLDDFGHPAGTVITLTAMKRVQRPVQRLISGTARYTFADLLGTSALFRAQLELAQAAARSDAGVLITGESGTGKEVVAQSIHNASSRASGPFVGINCAAIPRDLLESELFGHEEGAFTGARRGGQPGKFEVVEGGTLLLDEIGDMPLETQAKLLRVLQERRFQRVGGNREHVLEARVLATTNRDLDELARTGRFRQDLLYRLKVIHVHLPALRERPEDIPAMVQVFLERLSARLGRHLTRVAPEVLAALVGYPWPGNVRELEHLLESEVNIAPESATTLTRVPPSLLVARRRRETMVGIQVSSLLMASGGAQPAIRPLQGAEKEVLLAALEQHGGNVLAISKTLGVCRNKVYSMLRRFDLSLESYRKPGGAR